LRSSERAGEQQTSSLTDHQRVKDCNLSSRTHIQFKIKALKLAYSSSKWHFTHTVICTHVFTPSAHLPTPHLNTACYMPTATHSSYSVYGWLSSVTQGFRDFWTIRREVFVTCESKAYSFKFVLR